MFLGNTFVFIQFQGKDHIDKATRELVLTVLVAVGILGVIFLVTLQKVNEPLIENGREIVVKNDDAISAFKNAIKLFITSDMLLLSVTFLYTGSNRYHFFLFFLLFPKSFK